MSFFLKESGGHQSQGEVGFQQHVLGAPQEPRLHQHGILREPVVAAGSVSPSLSSEGLRAMHKKRRSREACSWEDMRELGLLRVCPRWEVVHPPEHPIGSPLCSLPG